MAREPSAANGTSKQGGMERLMSSLGHLPGKLPPIERWDPPFCGDIDMRIASDGQWFYMGTPIGRPALVRLFSSVLKLEDGRFVLVTPVEKVGITVEDAPFQAVEMAIDGEGASRQLSFRSNVGDVVMVSADNALRFGEDASGGVRPYVHIRRGLWARVTRALTYDLLAMGEVCQHDGTEMFGVTAGGIFYPVMAAAALEGLA
jgi:uncharacterized protein